MTTRKEPGHSIPGMDDGWAIFRDDGEAEELLAVVDTETLADALIAIIEQASPTDLKPVTIDALLDAIKQVESGGNVMLVGDGGAAHGAYQIHEGYFRDAIEQMAREHTGMYEGYLAAVTDDIRAREIIKAYWRRYQHTNYDFLERQEPHLITDAAEILARAHNGGGINGPKIAATIPYWNKVKAVLQKWGFAV